jgi:anthranilate phosphoribosyltransferase
MVEECGTVAHIQVDPRALGIELARPEDLRGGDPEHNALILREVIGGDHGPRRDIVLLNAAAALWAAEAVDGLKDGLAVAAQSIDGGHAWGKLEALIRATQGATA